METNWNQLIERYLNNELSAEGKPAFETELQKNTELQTEFELHKLTRELIQRNSLRTLVNQSGKWFHLKKLLINSGITLVIAGALASAVYFAVTWKEHSSHSDKPKQLEQSLIEQLEKQLAFENVDPEYFQFTGESDVFLTESGVLLSITDKSFLLNGKPYAGEAIVQLQEAQKASDIVKAGLSTKSGDNLLETQGMFSLNAFTPEGKKLELTKEGVYVQVPVDELKKDMMLFTGVPGKDGAIDWQNPVELDRLPKPKDMAKMDLFPPRYEPKLNELKWFTEKAKRDSLYLSFEEHGVPMNDSTSIEIEQLQMYTQPKMETPKRISQSPNNGVASISMTILPRPQDINYQVEGKQVPAERVEDKVHWEFSIKKIAGTKEAWVIAKITIDNQWLVNSIRIPKGAFGIPTEFVIEKSKDYTLIGPIIEPDPIREIDKETGELMSFHTGKFELKQKIRIINAESSLTGKFSYQTCKMNSYCLPPYEGYIILDLGEGGGQKSHIPPSKVLAIWNKKFNNTNLATQDFEDRMKAIHETCDEKVFDVYAKNLNEPLWKLDERVVKMGYPQFRQFADQRVGAIQINDVHQKNLNAFYETAIETLRETGKKNLETALKKDRQWDEEVMQERESEELRGGVRANLNAESEANFNLAHISKQLGQTVGFAITSETVASRDRLVSKRWSGPGIPAKQKLPIVVNIDRLTKSLLSSRNSVDVFTLDKGKKASIRYSDITANVESYQNFERLYFYLLPKQLNSYERLDFVNGKLNYPLNEAITYSGLAFGMNEKGFYLFEIPEMNVKDLGSIKLEQVSEKQFESRLKELNKNRGVYQEQITSEIDWLFKEKVNYKVQRKRRENVQFRNTIRPTIYSCLNQKNSTTYPAAGPQQGTFQESLPGIFTDPVAVSDVPPSFPGGIAALKKFLSDNIEFPDVMYDKNINGKVHIRFIVDEKGAITNATIKKGIPDCPECDQEALRVVKKLPPFIPGETNGQNVASSYGIPISFKTN